MSSTRKKNAVVLKVGMVGDAGIGKTSLMVRYIENSFDEDYIQTLGVNFMEKTVSVRKTEITFSIWDLGGQREFVNMLPLVCNEAAAILFMFDLSRQPTLNSIKDWYRQVRGFNKTAIAILIGTKYDIFAKRDAEYQADVTKMARRFAKSMKAPLIFCSSSYSINVKKIFKVVLARAFDLKCTVPEHHTIGEPLIEYSHLDPETTGKPAASSAPVPVPVPATAGGAAAAAVPSVASTSPSSLAATPLGGGGDEDKEGNSSSSKESTASLSTSPPK